MLFISLVAVAGAAALLGQQAPVNEVDPLLGSPLQTGPEPATLHAQVRSEPRDAEWASRTEQAIRARTLQIPPIGKNGNALRVTCATKLCEIAGSIRTPHVSPGEYDPKSPGSRALSALQGSPFTDEISKLGLKHETSLFTGSKDNKNQLVFMLYFSRAR